MKKKNKVLEKEHFRVLGLKIKKPRKNVAYKNGFELYKYKKPDGSFDYEKYKAVQTEGNKAKLDKVWVVEENIEFLADYISKNMTTVEFGVCHGTRRGLEQEWFNKYLDCDVIGTEISDTADQFPNTIQWDFHEVKPEWIDSVDFIYSNSFDHSYDPRKCIKAWMSCIKKGGMCIIEHTSDDERANQLDSFGVDVAILPYLILTWGEGNYSVRLLKGPSHNASAKTTGPLKYIQYLIVQNV